MMTRMGDTTMTLDKFRQSLAATEPPAGLTHALAGLWWDAKGDWTRAHESAQQDEDHRICRPLLRPTELNSLQFASVSGDHTPYSPSKIMP